MCKVFEETDELNDFVVLDDLQPSEADLPFLVDWNYHAPSGDREACSRPGREMISYEIAKWSVGCSLTHQKAQKSRWSRLGIDVNLPSR